MIKVTNGTPRLVFNCKVPLLWVRHRLYSQDNELFVYNELYTIVYLHTIVYLFNDVQTIPST